MEATTLLMNQVLVSLIVDAKIAVKPNIIVKTNNNSELLSIFKKYAKFFIKANFQIFSGLDNSVKKGIKDAKDSNSAIELNIITNDKIII